MIAGGPVAAHSRLRDHLFRRILAATGTLLAAAVLIAAAGAVEILRPALSFSATPPPSTPALGRICAGDTIARISVPRLNYEAPVREGADAATLAHGPGHVPGTALPGEVSGRKHAVIALAGDSGAAFASQLLVGDVVELRTPFGLRTYRVVSRRAVRPEDLRLDPTDEPTLTLVSSYPANPVGPAPLRLAVSAEPVSTEGARSSSATRSVTRSTGRMLTLAETAMSRAFSDGR